VSYSHENANMRVDVQTLAPLAEPAKPGVLRRIPAYLAKSLASPPKGDYGGWEGGARGL
jgi:hypothetical protein